MGRYTKFLVDDGIGTDRLLRRLTVAERWCFVAGVLATANKSPERGWLLIEHGEPATVRDIAEEAGVTRAVADAAVSKLEGLGQLLWDEQQQAFRVIDWDAVQVRQRPSDSAEATRERKRRSRARAAARLAAVPRDPREEKRREAVGGNQQ